MARIDQSAGTSSNSTSKQPTTVRTRKSGHIERWVEEQRRLATDGVGMNTGTNARASDSPTIGTPCHPYLAYPHITWPAPKERADDGASLADYVIVEDEEHDGEWTPTPVCFHILHSIIIIRDWKLI